MLSFFAMTWDTALQASIEAARQLQAKLPESLIRHRGKDFLLLDLRGSDGAARCIPLCQEDSEDAGAVYGVLFRRAPESRQPERVTCLSGSECNRIVRSNASSLCSDYWGTYVAFVRTPAGLSVLSDPSGGLSCYYAELNGVLTFFSHLESCAFLDRSEFSVDEAFIARLLVYDKIQTGETGLREVKELAGGERLQITHRKPQIDRIWDPRIFAQRPFDRSVADAASELRHICRSVTAAWASCFGEVSVSLSGGLDSAIVLSCLTKRGLPARTSAFHSLLQSADAPELRFARDSADLGGVDLQVIESSLTDGLPDPGTHPASVRPFRSFLALPVASPFAMAPDEQLRAAIFTGQGGDHLFLARRSPLGFADHLLRCGLGRTLIPELLNASRLSGLSVWKTAAAAFSLLSPRISAVEEAIRLRQAKLSGLSPAILDMQRSYPEWALDGRGIAPLKFLQLSSLSHLQQARNRLAETRPWTVIDPLISQPLIEFCLQVPSETLCTGGVSRGLARQAFAGDIPDSIRLRMSKGSASSYFGRFFFQNRRQLFDALYQGELVRRGFLSPADLEFLSGLSEAGIVKLGRSLLIWYAIEAWLRTWKPASG